VGYGRRIGARGSFSLGAAFSGSERSGGLGFGLDL
jgi:trimeric autotransporter adhesin